MDTLLKTKQEELAIDIVYPTKKETTKFVGEQNI